MQRLPPKAVAQAMAWLPKTQARARGQPKPRAGLWLPGQAGTSLLTKRSFLLLSTVLGDFSDGWITASRPLLPSVNH